MRHFNLDVVHPSWQPCFTEALKQMDLTYLETLYNTTDWLPGADKIFNAFSLPVSHVNYVLFGESPYPRAASANGFAFWDQAVTDIWSEAGLSKKVNRATSLRNLIKMLLVADGALPPNQTGQPEIANLDKSGFVKTNTELFQNLINHGFLLLNASLVLRPSAVAKDARSWYPFIKHLLLFLFKQRPNLQLILFGRIANTIDALVDQFQIKRLYAEHPYNHTFICNQEVLEFFRPLKLLSSSINTETA